MTRHTITDTNRAAMWAVVKEAPSGHTLEVKAPSKDRSIRQNNTLHKWFAQIAQQSGDVSKFEVKAQCNLTYGVPILSRDDPEWASAFGYIFRDLNHAAKLKALRVLDIPVTRGMKVPQLCEYMDQMARDYRQAGFALVDPEARQYEAAS